MGILFPWISPEYVVELCSSLGSETEEGAQSRLISYLTCADRKEAYNSWYELSQQLDISGSLRLIAHLQFTAVQRHWVHICSHFFNQTIESVDEVSVGTVRTQRCFGPWARCLFDVPHALCLPPWVGAGRQEQGQQRFGATTLRCYCCPNVRGTF